jgi:hypothetical protein
MDQNQLSKICEYRLASVFMMPVILSNIKDLLLLSEKYLVDAIDIRCHDGIKARLLQFNKTTKKVVHDFGQTISIFSRMKLYLLNKTWIPSGDSQKIRVKECLYEQ